jgi:signal transduction histidine kinase
VTSRAKARLAWGLAGLSFVIVALWLAMVIAYHRELGQAHTIFDGSSALAAVAYPTVGVLIAVRRRGNRIGWLMIFIGLSFGLSCVVHAYTERGPLVGPHAPVAGQWADWLGTWVWVPGWLFLVTLLLLLFPDGHPPSPRWRPAIWATFAVAAMMILGSWLDPHPDSQATYRNPTAAQATRGLAGPLEIGALVLGIAVAAVCLAGLVTRFRRSGGEQRQQMKWFAYAGIATLVLLPGNTVLATSGVLQVMGYVDVLLLPVAVGFAIMKYRLYDIDFVISKTIVYGTLAAFITAVYVLVVAGIGSLGSGALGAGSRPDLGLSILATAVVAVAFQPVRERVQHLANRAVFGKRATPYEALSLFAGRMGGTYAAEDVLPRMAQVLAEGTGASRAVVWLKAGDGLAAGACWPAGSLPPARVTFRDGEVPVITGADRIMLVQHQGETLGALSVSKRPGESLTPVEDKLMSDLGAQAGLVLRNVGLTEQLQARLAELQASRLRIVAAQHDQRRRIERDIHDGAQQQLLGITSKLALAQSVAGQDDERERALIAELKAETGDALATLRELARGIYPSLLADQGITPALIAQARKAPGPVEVQADGLGRYPAEIETAIYFCCVEALQNAARHAPGSAVRVTLAGSGTEVTFTVADSGPGFDPAAVTAGSGLQNMSDRLAALGGSCQVDSSPGRGTTVAGRIGFPAPTPENAGAMPLTSHMG